jgi:hypothetical protein
MGCGRYFEDSKVGGWSCAMHQGVKMQIHFLNFFPFRCKVHARKDRDRVH